MNQILSHFSFLKIFNLIIIIIAVRKISMKIHIYIGRYRKTNLKYAEVKINKQNQREKRK